jgi:hypothetical protein
MSDETQSGINCPNCPYMYDGIICTKCGYVPPAAPAEGEDATEKLREIIFQACKHVMPGLEGCTYSPDNLPGACKRLVRDEQRYIAENEQLLALLKELEGIADEQNGLLVLLQSHYGDRGEWPAMDKKLDAATAKHTAYKERTK